MTTETEAVETEAKSIGWVPLEQFRGDKEKFVDAETYLKRGQEFIPFLRASNKRLEEQVGSLRGELEGAKRMLTANEAALTEINKTTAEQVKAAAEAARADALRELEVARKDGDVDAAVAAQQKADAAQKAAEDAAKPKPAPTNGQLADPPGWQGFIKDNPWWNEDPVMRAASTAVTQQLAASGVLAGLTIEQRWARVAEETKKRFAGNERRQEDSRVEGSRATPEDRSSASSGKSYADLPAEAKEACDSPALVNRLVGKDKKFPDLKAWRQNYAETYFRS